MSDFEFDDDCEECNKPGEDCECTIQYDESEDEGDAEHGDGCHCSECELEREDY